MTDQSAIYDSRAKWALRWIPADQFNCLPATYRSLRERGLPPFGLGGMEFCDRVFTPAQYVTDIVLPRFRQVQGLQVIGVQEMPEWAQALADANAATLTELRQNGRESGLSAARVRIE